MPRSHKADPRDHFVSFRCTETEVTRLHRRAARAGMSLSNYARAVLLQDGECAAVAGPVRVVEENSTARMLVEQVRRVGVNINQIAHRMNELRIPPPCDLSPVLEEIRLYVRQARAL